MYRTKKQMLLADLSLLLVAIIWGTGFVVTKGTLSGIGPMYMVAWRFLLGTIIVGLVSFKKIKTISKQDIIGGAIVGVILYFGFITQTIGMKYTTVGKSAFLTGTNVVMVPFLVALIYKKWPDEFALWGAVLCFVGVSLLNVGSNLFASGDGLFSSEALRFIFSFNLGDIWTLVCALGFAMHITANGKFVHKMDPMVLTFIQFVVTTILGFITAFIFEGAPAMPEPNTVKGILYLGMFSTCIAFMVQTMAQKYTTTTHTAIILSLESLFGTMLGIFIFSEPFTLVMGLGCFIIILSILTVETRWSFLFKKNTSDELDKELEIEHIDMN